MRQQRIQARRLALTAIVLAATVPSAAAQSRDHLSLQEVELVQDAQILDKRIDVFIKAIDRRMLALTGTDAASARQIQKDSEKWGELPKGTRAELIDDIAKILDEAITNIDDVSLHDEKNPLIPKALRKLTAEATRVHDQLLPMRAHAETEVELGNLEEALENTQSIIDAANKLPPPTETREKGKGGKSKDKP